MVYAYPRTHNCIHVYVNNSKSSTHAIIMHPTFISFGGLFHATIGEVGKKVFFFFVL